MGPEKHINFSRDFGIITINTFIIGKKTLKKIIMVLDTASYLTLITPSTAKILGFSQDDSIGKMKISSPIGEEQGFRIKVKKIEACYKSQDNFEIGVIPLHNTYGIDGLLGLNFLDKYDLAISFKNSTITLK